jgi:hypothetical protein
MFQPLVIALALAAVLFIVYLLVRAYRPRWFQWGSKAPKAEDTFVAAAAEPVAGPPEPSKLNTPAPPIPAPAPPVQDDPPMPEREVAPGGPGAPNAAAPPDTPATLSPEVNPIDPYDDKNMEAPIHDSMRHPELSFGPGVENTGMNQLALSGVGSTRASAAESPFSPEFAQNGGTFMGAVFANDLKRGDNFAEA